MIGNFTERQVLWAIIIIIIIVWIIWYFFYRNKQMGTTVVYSGGFRQPFANLAPPHPHPPISPTIAPVQPNDQPKSSFVLYYFFNPNCYHCKRFSGAWDEISNRLNGLNNLSTQAIDVTNPEMERLVFYYNVNSTPTLILNTPDKDIEYSGDRSPDDLHRFVISNINEYSK